ncbi:MAG TPA: NAD(P)-binding protein [Frankiaceae bacterium]|nr:NAD(P)-binding protein [Frankiaceae bacterium]
MLGAGLSGLTAAHLLSTVEGTAVDVFEARRVPGGRANVEDGGEHCQRLFLADYQMLLPLLEEIPHADGRSVRDCLVPMRRFARAPTLGWIEISHHYSMIASEISLLEKLRMARASRRSILLARHLRGPNTNFLGAPKNKYSLRSKFAVLSAFLRRQDAFSLPGPTDEYFIDPWVRLLSSRGANFHLASAVERIIFREHSVELLVGGRRERFDAVISTLFVSSLRTLLDQSDIAHSLPRSEHAHCACFTIHFDPAERSPRTSTQGLYTHQGINIMVQPKVGRCTALCIRTPRSDEGWVLSRVAEMLELSHSVAAVRHRANTAADEALFIGDHVRRDRVFAGAQPGRFQVAGSWIRDDYPVDSGESATLSAFESVRAICRSLGLEPPLRPGG